MFFIVPSILTFDFDLIFRSFFTFWDYFRSWGRAQKLFLGLLTFNFYSSLHSDFWFWLDSEVIFFTFWGLMGNFWGRGRAPKSCWVYSCGWTNFFFYSSEKLNFSDFQRVPSLNFWLRNSQITKRKIQRGDLWKSEKSSFSDLSETSHSFTHYKNMTTAKISRI